MGRQSLTVKVRKKVKIVGDQRGIICANTCHRLIMGVCSWWTIELMSPSDVRLVLNFTKIQASRRIVNVWHQQIRVEFSSPYTTPKRSVNSLFYGSAYLLPQSYVCITWNEQSGHLLLGKFVQKTLLNIHQTLNKCTLGCKENNVKIVPL